MIIEIFHNTFETNVFTFDTIHITLGKLWDNIETALGPHGDYLKTIGEAYICPVGSVWPFFGSHLLLVFSKVYVTFRMQSVSQPNDASSLVNETFTFITFHIELKASPAYQQEEMESKHAPALK